MCSTRPLVRFSAGCLYRMAATTLGGLGVSVFPCKCFRENESHVSHSRFSHYPECAPSMCHEDVTCPGMMSNRLSQSVLIADITGCLIKPGYPCCEPKRLSGQPKSFQGSKIHFYYALVSIKVWSIPQYPFDGVLKLKYKLVISKRYLFSFMTLNRPVISENTVKVVFAK